MTGMQMMLKSFGLDPNEIQKALGGTVQAIQTFDVRLRNIETQLSLLTKAQMENAMMLANFVRALKEASNGRGNGVDTGSASGNGSSDSSGRNGNSSGTDSSGSVASGSNGAGSGS